jgi:hypothetical protein
VKKVQYCVGTKQGYRVYIFNVQKEEIEWHSYQYWQPSKLPNLS